MDHQIAVKKLAAQRYMLGEMTPAEREQFESHYFACPQCAEEVVETAAFVDNLKAVLKAEAAEAVSSRDVGRESLWRRLWRPGSGFWGMVPAVAAVVFCVAAGYLQFVRIPALRQSLAPRAAVTALIRPSDVRGEIPVVAIPADAAYGIALMLVDPGSSARELQFEMRRPDGALAEFVRVAVDGPISGGAQVQIPLQAEKFTPGRYIVSMRERPSETASWSEVIATYEFEVQRN